MRELKAARGSIGQFIRRPAGWLIAGGCVMLALPVVCLVVIHRLGLSTAQVFTGPRAIEPTIDIGGLSVSLAGLGLLGCTGGGAALLGLGLCLSLLRQRRAP